MPLKFQFCNPHQSLHQWRLQWQVDRRLRSIPTPLFSDVKGRDLRPGQPPLVRPFTEGPAPAVGHIRLLSPHLVPAGRGPAYIALLSRTEAGGFLAAPFSRFQVPATPKEMFLREAPPALAVLALWNARPISGFVAGQSWFTDNLTPEEIGEIRSVLSPASCDSTASETWSHRLGLPIDDLEDSRLEYMDEEGELWQIIAGMNAVPLMEPHLRLSTFPARSTDKAFLLAAESEDDFSPLAVINISPHDTFLHAFIRPSKKTILLLAADSEGALSENLDGAHVLSTREGLLGKIVSGQCMIRAHDPEGLVFLGPDGVPLLASPVHEGREVHPFSYVHLVSILGQAAEAVTSLTDSELNCLALHSSLDPAIDAATKGERAFRARLYKGLSTIKQSHAQVESHPYNHPELFEKSESRSELATLTMPDYLDNAAEDWVRERAKAFAQSDGIFPVVTGDTGEAIPIAFQLRFNESPSTLIRDLRGEPIPPWSEAEEIFGSLHTQRIGIQLQCCVRAAKRQFKGESFELPILLALARKRGELPDYPILSVMSSGAMRGDSVHPALAMEAKIALAEKMGISIFVAPESWGHGMVMGIPSGASFRDLLSQLSTRMEEMGLDRPDIQTVADRINNLGDELHQGLLPFTEAIHRLNRYEKYLTDAEPSKITTECIIRLKVLRGSIANHSGDADAGQRLTNDAAVLAEKARLPLLYVNAMVNRVVSLTDLGYIGEAESTGRHLLNWVLKEFSGSAAEQMQAEMVASGALGGQPLLHRAVQEPEFGSESLKLLMRALELSNELSLPSDQCRGAVQVALWYALLDTTRAGVEADTADQILRQHPGSWSVTSFAYLHRVRLLGAYRSLVLGKPLELRLADWPLPEASLPHLSWVRATALKYRGAILAARGDMDAAQNDFAEAWARLDREPAALLQFIGATVALAAGEALLNCNRPLALSYLEKAKVVFMPCSDRFEKMVKGALWLQRTEGLIHGANPGHLPNPQRHFVY